MDDPAWQAFVKDYQAAFPPEKRFRSPSLLATNYYGSTMALILALKKVDGDLSDNQSKLKAALASLEIDAPNGKIKLDANRQAIGTNFVTEVVDDGKGALFSKVVKVIPNVNQTLGYDSAVFAKIGLPSRTVPECKKYEESQTAGALGVGRPSSKSQRSNGRTRPCILLANDQPYKKQ